MVTTAETNIALQPLIDTLNQPPDSENPLDLRVRIITPGEFAKQGLDQYRNYVYSQYRPDKTPQPVLPAIEIDNHQAYYLLATQGQN